MKSHKITVSTTGDKTPLLLRIVDLMQFAFGIDNVKIEETYANPEKLPYFIVVAGVGEKANDWSRQFENESEAMSVLRIGGSPDELAKRLDDSNGPFMRIEYAGQYYNFMRVYR